MIGFQDLVVKNNIKVYELAEDIQCSPSNIYDWFRNNKIPKKRLKVLAEKFNVTEEYLNTKVNDINTYQPKKKGFCNEYKIDGDITYIYIVNRKNEKYKILIDTEDLERLIEFNAMWFLSWSETSQKNYVSAMKYDGINDKGKTKYKAYYLERFITNAPPKTHVDHHDQNPLNNRKYNLRVTSVSNNNKYRKSKNSNNTTGFRNVILDKKSGKYIIMLCSNNKRFRVGEYYNTPEEAGRDAEIYRRQYYGEFAGYD